MPIFGSISKENLVDEETVPSCFLTDTSCQEALKFTAIWRLWLISSVLPSNRTTKVAFAASSKPSRSWLLRAVSDADARLL